MEEEFTECEYKSDPSLGKEIIERESVIVDVPGKGKVLRNSARKDVVAEKEYKDAFFLRISGRVIAEENNELILVLNEEDEVLFTANDITCKLPLPSSVGGSRCRSNYMKFNCDFNRWICIKCRGKKTLVIYNTRS